MKQIEFCEQVSQYRYQFYITAYALLRNEADAEDAVCNAILSGYEHMAQLKNPKKFKSWMLTITKNEALKLCRRRVDLPGDAKMEQMLPPTYDNHNELWDIVQALQEAMFRETILDFLGGGKSEEDMESMGVESEKHSVGSKLDLRMELQESVMDSHSIYLLVEMTAPPGITFGEDVLFDDFSFCRGTNYSAMQRIGGTRSCELLEVNEDLPNMATYVVSLVFDEVLEEGEELTVCFEDLTRAPYSDNPELLLEGMWSITFFYHPTVADHIELEGTPDMVFSFINTTADLLKLELSPFGIFVYADVSNFPSDELGVSDTNIAIRLKMIDGSELTVVSHDLDVRGYTQGGSISFSNEGEKTFEQVNLEFTNVIDLGKVVGVYIEDLYVPLR